MQENKLFRQRRIRILGELVDSIFTAMPVFSAYSIVATTVILYEATKPYILNYVPWMNVLWFLLFLGVAFIPILLLVYKYVIPSVWNFRSTQMSHLESKMNALSKQLDKLLDDKSGEKDENSSSE